MLWAIIDDGVNVRIPEIVKNIEIDRLGNVSIRNPSIKLNHATICFNIIKKYAYSLFDAISIKILDEQTQRCGKDALVAALIWCMENDVRLIHMSIGTTGSHDFGAVEEAVGKLAERGVVIVATGSNKGVQTYPAFDKRVIGVECDTTLEGDQFIHTPNALNGNTFRASARHQLATDEGIITTPFSNSFSAPVITAQLLNLAEQGKEFSHDRAMEWLREKALCTDGSFLFVMPREQEKAVVIVLLGLDRWTAGQLMTELKGLFARHGYLCFLAASVDFGLPEVAVISARLTLKRYLYWARSFFANDVIMVALEDHDMVHGISEQVDLIVTNKYTEVLAGDSPSPCEVVMCVDSHGAARTIPNIYKDIIYLLSEEEMSGKAP